MAKFCNLGQCHTAEGISSEFSGYGDEKSALDELSALDVFMLAVIAMRL